MSTIMVYVVVLRLFALGLISGGVMTIPFIGDRSGSDVNHVRLDALITMNLFQLVTVPLGLLIGILLVFMRSWARPPGYVMAAATIVFGVVVATQAWAVMSWAEGPPPGIGDPDGEVGLGVLNVLGGAFTILVGVSIASMRWAGWEAQVVSARRTRSRRAPRSRRTSSAHVKRRSRR
ncbi:hypothetical protein E1295_36160 [Nonomuraea mesophila]|uniref:Uncharacterized protein n=1 Tax=Nonomuraea mesophila TaxID=2530382 RepID=A0A4R5EL49_9ACTN|nr:hypothetical protein [Nonomuraea mesophila]TDE35369.1 hypothetical protein E1295_36160 [Nonomuraea mesophila]